MAMKPIIDAEPPYLGVHTAAEIAIANAEIAAGSMYYITGSSLTRAEDGAVLFLVGVGNQGSFTGLATTAALAGLVKLPDTFISLTQFNPKGDGTDDMAAFTAFISALRTRSAGGGLVYGEIPASPYGEWIVNGTLLFNVSNLRLGIGGSIRQISTARRSTLLFAYDAQQQPAQPLRNVAVEWTPGVTVNGNGQNMIFTIVQGDGSDNDSAVRFNYIDDLFFSGVHATYGPIDSMSVRRCRNWLGEQVEMSHASPIDSLNRLGNGFSATTDWDAANWSENDTATWGHGNLRNFVSHDNPGGTGATAFNVTGVWFDDGYANRTYTSYSYEKQFQQPALKMRFGGFRNCHGRNATDGFYIDDNGVTVNDQCSIDGITARSGDTNNLHGNGATLSACSNFYVGGKFNNAANAGIAMFNGSGVAMVGEVSPLIDVVGSHGIYDRGTSQLRVTARASIRAAAGYGIYSHNAGGANYNQGGTSTVVVENPWIESCGQGAMFSDYKGVMDVSGIRGLNNCTAKAAGAGIGVELDQTGYARIRGLNLRDSSGKQGFLMKASASVAVLNEFDNTGDAAVAVVASVAPVTTPQTARGYSAGAAELVRGQNLVAATNGRARMSLSVTSASTFLGTYIDALRTDTLLGVAAPNAHKLVFGAFNGSTPVEKMNVGGSGAYFGNGTTDARNDVDVGGSIGFRVNAAVASAAADVTSSFTEIDATAANVTLTLASASSLSRHYHVFTRVDAGVNIATVTLSGGATFSDGTTSKVVTTTTPLRVLANATSNRWNLV